MALTQLRSFGAATGGRYGSFAEKGGPQPRPVGKITQLRAFGAHAGQRYGQFSRVPPVPPVPPPGPISGRRIQLPFALVDQLRLQRMDEEDILLIIAAQIASHSIH